MPDNEPIAGGARDVVVFRCPSCGELHDVWLGNEETEAQVTCSQTEDQYMVYVPEFVHRSEEE